MDTPSNVIPSVDSSTPAGDSVIKSEIVATIRHETFEKVDLEAVDKYVSLIANEIIGVHGTFYTAESGASQGGLGMTRGSRQKFRVAARKALRELYPSPVDDQ